MLTVRYIFTFCFIFLFASATHATNKGCLLPDTRIYTNKMNPGLLGSLLGSTPIYDKNSFVIVDNQCVTPLSSSCRVCLGSYSTFLGVITGCNTGFVYGSEANYLVECDLDSSPLVLILIGGSYVAMILHRRNAEFL